MIIIIYLKYKKSEHKPEERAQGEQWRSVWECKEGEHRGESVEESARRGVQGGRVQRGGMAPGRSACGGSARGKSERRGIHEGMHQEGEHEGRRVQGGGRTQNRECTREEGEEGVHV